MPPDPNGRLTDKSSAASVCLAAGRAVVHTPEAPEGRACADDVATLAPPDKVQTMIYELEDALQ